MKTVMTDQNTLPAVDRMQQRNESAAELVKALLIINGGGAVALLAFLQASLGSAPAFSKPTVIGGAFLSFCALSAPVFPFFRYLASPPPPRNFTPTQPHAMICRSR